MNDDDDDLLKSVNHATTATFTVSTNRFSSYKKRIAQIHRIGISCERTQECKIDEMKR